MECQPNVTRATHPGTDYELWPVKEEKGDVAQRASEVRQEKLPTEPLPAEGRPPIGANHRVSREEPLVERGQALFGDDFRNFNSTEAVKALMKKPPGTFVVRPSSVLGYYALSVVKADDTIDHSLLEVNERGEFEMKLYEGCWRYPTWQKLKEECLLQRGLDFFDNNAAFITKIFELTKQIAQKQAQRREWRHDREGREVFDVQIPKGQSALLHKLSDYIGRASAEELDYKDDGGWTLLLRIADLIKNEGHFNLHLEQYKTIIKQLIDKGVSVNAADPESGNTALHFIAQIKHADVKPFAEPLMRAGASPFRKNYADKTANEIWPAIGCIFGKLNR
ncbi:MAG: hypothetical protein K940chlam7_00177 [Chlamydiae bacterium]|nr:hypothetical protein [Chlamydiota bacterium]